MHLTGSIVLYKNDAAFIQQIIQDFFRLEDRQNRLSLRTLYLIDNSPTDELRHLYDQCEYHENLYYENLSKNIGFGAAHNIAISYAREAASDYHVLINPDVRFDARVLPEMVDFLVSHPEVGMLAPRVFYPDGSPQHLCKMLPNPWVVVLRRFSYSERIREYVNRNYEMRWVDYTEPVEVPFLSGCFMLLPMHVLEEIGGFDERYFLYVEDMDLSRRVGERYKTMCLPSASITHIHSRGSYHDTKLLYHHVASMIKYFNKWGWCCDTKRRALNERALAMRPIEVSETQSQAGAQS